MFGNKKTVSLVLALTLGMITEVANADFFYGTPTNLGSTVNSPAEDTSPSLSADGLLLFFDSNRSGGSGGWDIWVTTRETIHDDWGTPVNLGPTVNSSTTDGNPGISADGLSLFFDSERPGGHGGRDIWLTTRDTKDGEWGTPLNLGSTINGPSYDAQANLSPDGLSFFFSSNRPGGYGNRDTWLTTRETTNGPWSEPLNLGQNVNSSTYDSGPSISADGRSLFFGSSRPGGHGGRDIWLTKRGTLSEPFGPMVNLGPTVNSSSQDITPFISVDGSTLYFCSDRPGGMGGHDLWYVSVEPIIDLNGDGTVDSGDMRVMVNHWGEDDPLCDIGPTPFGDGIVDVQDLVVLAEHLFEDVNDPTLLAHWALDETEGSIARDGVSGNDDLVMGSAIWQPTGGVVGGALELDGVDDHVITTFGLNPSGGPISIFAWIKGGAPGQVIISEPMGTDWLLADTEGKLMTELKSAGRDATALLSQTVITDGAWHRVGLVWDGSRRMLCVDGVTVAEDTQNGLEAYASGLYIGVGNDYAPGSFLLGLIDDIRIYNRVVSP